MNFLIIRVLDDDHSLLCWNAFNIDCLRQGYRSFEMKSPELKNLNTTTILGKINFIEQNPH